MLSLLWPVLGTYFKTQFPLPQGFCFSSDIFLHFAQTFQDLSAFSHFLVAESIYIVQPFFSAPEVDEVVIVWIFNVKEHSQMTKIRSVPSHEVIQINWQLIVRRLPAFFQVPGLTEAIFRPTSVVRIEFDVVGEFSWLGALLRDKKLRDDLELPEEDHILVAMES